MQLDSALSKNAVLYLRVSSEEQVENFSLGYKKKFVEKKRSGVAMKLLKRFEKRADQLKI